MLTLLGLQVLSQSALAYYRTELSEQGRNILDSILRSYPKRLDLWNLYMDQVDLLLCPASGYHCPDTRTLTMFDCNRKANGVPRAKCVRCSSAAPRQTCRPAR